MRKYSLKEVSEAAHHTVSERLIAWYEQGRGIAVYENRDLGHGGFGHRKFVSFGLPDSTFLSALSLPERLPDTPQAINWRYLLVGLVPPRGLDTPTPGPSGTPSGA